MSNKRSAQSHRCRSPPQKRQTPARDCLLFCFFSVLRLFELLGKIAEDARGGKHLNIAVALHAGTRRQELADNDILLEAEQRIALALDGGVGEDSCGLLEGRCRKEGLGCEGGLCDTHEHGHTLSFCELLACCLGLGGNARVLRLELELVNNGAGQEGSSTGIGYLDLLHHLTDDDLDVLIVDVNTLHTVGSLNLADEVIVNGLDAEDRKDIVRVESTLGDGVTLVDVIAGLNLDAHTVVDGICLLLESLGVGDDDVPDLLYLALGDGTGNLTDKSEALGLSRLEQLLNSGKTFRDIGLILRTAGVERSHRQLCTGLAYGLSPSQGWRRST